MEDLYGRGKIITTPTGREVPEHYALAPNDPAFRAAAPRLRRLLQANRERLLGPYPSELPHNRQAFEQTQQPSR